jgi:hypothetical protein
VARLCWHIWRAPLPRQPVGQLPTLRQWRAVLGEDLETHRSKTVRCRARMPASCAHATTSAAIAERAEAIRQVIRDAVDAGFNLDAPTCIVASPGRFRVFMGHTDLPGLGGPTINGATREELIGVAQSARARWNGTIAVDQQQQRAVSDDHTIDIVQLRRIAGRQRAVARHQDV